MHRMWGVGLVAASALALAGCAGNAGSADDGRIDVVASTDVYGQIAEAIGGDAVSVTSLIDSAAQDPHAFEPSARDQLAVSQADLVIDNGGGYDPFVDALLDASSSTAPVITAVNLLDDGAAATGDGQELNEHVWYSLATIASLADAVSAELAALRPDDAATFTANTAAFIEGVTGLQTDLQTLDASVAGDEIFVSEPVPLYLTDAAGLVNLAPDAFTEAVEEGQDVPPATLLTSLDLIASGDVRVVIVNAQTGGAETTQVTDAAASVGVPVVSFAETLPEGSTYLEWMGDNIQALSDALGA